MQILRYTTTTTTNNNKIYKKINLNENHMKFFYNGK